MKPLKTLKPRRSRIKPLKPLKLLFYFSFFILHFSFSSCSHPSTPHAQLLIVQTSDTHSCIEPDASTNTGGYVRRAAIIDSLRTHVDPDLLLFDCGDYSQGSLYYNLFKGEAEIRLMNAMRYDAATIGNHEFDFGEDNMLRLFQLATFPTLCCNYDVSSTCLKDAVRPYTVIERKGLRIGVFGVCPPMEGLVAEKNCEGIRYLDPIAEANRIVPILRGRERCDVVICLSHLGWQIDNLIDDVKFIAGTRGIDLVLGGHTHSTFEAPVRYANIDGDSIPLMHNGKNASHLGLLTLTVE